MGRRSEPWSGCPFSPVSCPVIDDRQGRRRRGGGGGGVTPAFLITGMPIPRKFRVPPPHTHTVAVRRRRSLPVPLIFHEVQAHGVKNGVDKVFLITFPEKSIYNEQFCDINHAHIPGDRKQHEPGLSVFLKIKADYKRNNIRNVKKGEQN